MSYHEAAHVYDLLYASGKDYGAEAQLLADLVRDKMPAANALLDVACGTGEHAHRLARDHDFAVDGIDLEPHFVEIARAKHPHGQFRVADMVSFDLGRQYDVVLCLFGAVGYVRTLDRLAAAFECFTRHVAPGGLVIIEPWFPPGKLTDGHIVLRTGHDEHRTACRMSRTEVQERLSRLHFEYLIGDATGIARLSEVHELGLFTEDEMLQALRQAGVDPNHEESDLTRSGLYVGRRPSS